MWFPANPGHVYALSIISGKISPWFRVSGFGFWVSDSLLQSSFRDFSAWLSPHSDAGTRNSRLPCNNPIIPIPIPIPDPMGHEPHTRQRCRVSQWSPALRSFHSLPLLHPRVSHTEAHIKVGAYGNQTRVLSTLRHPVHHMLSSAAVTISAKRGSCV